MNSGGRTTIYHLTIHSDVTNKMVRYAVVVKKITRCSFLNVQNHGAVSQKFCNFATAREYQMPFGFLFKYAQVISV